MAFEVGQVELVGELVDPGGDFLFAQWAAFATGVGPGEKMLVGGDGVDTEVVLEGGDGVRGA